MVSDRRTKIDWVNQIREMLEVHYHNVPKVRLVMDNLNTHTVSSLYEAFHPEVARRLARRLEIHYTPKHGSWLNIAEIELSAMTRQCLDRSIATIATLREELSAWEVDRNTKQKGVDWQTVIGPAIYHESYLLKYKVNNICRIKISFMHWASSFLFFS